MITNSFTSSFKTLLLFCISLLLTANMHGQNVGIGTTSPTLPLTVRTNSNTAAANVVSLANAIGDSLFQLNVTRGAVTNTIGSWTTAIGQAYNGGTLTEAIKFYRGIGPGDGAMTFNTNNIERIKITSTGAIGIGNSNPHGWLHFPNTLANRKIVLFETTNNDHEYLGFGVNAGMLRYQVANANDNHVFFSGLTSTSSTELMRITGQGKVGIGTSTPLSTLDVEGGIAIGSSFAGAFVAPTDGAIFQGKVGIGWTNPLSFLDVNGGTVIGYDYAGLTPAPADGLLVQGKVGIGTSTPLSKLDVEGGLAIGSSFAGNFAAPQDGAIFQGKVGIGTNFPESKLDVEGGVAIGSGYASYIPAPQNGAIIKGRVGIGTPYPEAPLHIWGSSVTTLSDDRSYFNVGTGPFIINNTSPSGMVQVIAEGYFLAYQGGFIATSDQRIKNIKGLSDTQRDLATLNAIQVTDYTYIDEVHNGNTPQKKVIAQQLQSVFPQAVNTSSGIIPNVFEVASSSTVANHHTIITTLKAHGFTDSDQVRLILEDKGETQMAVEVVDANTFIVGEELPGKIFVYGKHVDDLLNVDYDAVAMLNVSATQELYKMIIELKAENAQLRQDLESRMTKMETTQSTNGL